MASPGGSNVRQSRPSPDSVSAPEDLCIRFVNTVAWRLRDPHEERLPSPDALLRWLGGNGLGSQRHLASVATFWANHPEAAADFYSQALALREAIYGVLQARITRRLPARAHLAALNAWLARPAGGVEIAAGIGGLGWRVTLSGAETLDLLRPVVLSAADLVTGPRAHKIRQCADDRGCGWLFVDESRAQNRRWCSMGDCGNRAKARRHRARERARAADPAFAPCARKSANL